MAIFEGSVKEFHRLIGPRIKNAVNSLTRKARSDLKGCELCGQKQELDSAHVHEKERRSIIESVIEPFVVNGIIRCNVEMVEEKIIHAHEPISSTFKFLCKSCHREYDNPSVVKTTRTLSRKESKKDTGNNDFAKIHKIENWSKNPIRSIIKL